MAVEFNPESDKPVFRAKAAPRKPEADKTALARNISGNTNRPSFQDPMDAIQQLLDGEVDMNAALGFIKSTVPADAAEVAKTDGTIDASTLTQQLLDGEIDRETFKAGMKALKEQPVPEELEEDAASLTEKLLRGEITRKEYLEQIKLLPEPTPDEDE